MFTPPRLPIETWRQIIRTATELPGAFDTTLRSPFHDVVDISEELDIGQRPRARPRGYRASLKTKLSTSTVCKMWRSIALEFLFEFLCIDVDEILSSSLAQIPETFDSAHVNPLRFVLRLQVDGVASRSSHARNDQYKILTLIFRHCPKLLIYKHSVSNMDTSLLTYLIASCGHSLRALEIVGPIPGQLPRLLTGLVPQLQVLKFDGFGAIKNNAPLPICLPALHTLHTTPEPETPHISNWDLPNLQRVDIGRANRLSPVIPPHVALRALPDHVTMISMHEPRVSIQYVLQAFPKLETIRWGAEPSFQWLDLKGCYPVLREVEVYFLDPLGAGWKFMTPSAPTVAFKALANRAMFPGLEIIRCNELRKEHCVPCGNASWNECLYQLRIHNVILEGRNDQNLLDPELTY